MLRHCKPLAAWGDGRTALSNMDISFDDPGVLVSDDVSSAFGEELLAALGLHRVWARAESVMSSTVAPVRTKAAPARRSRKR